MDSAQDSGLTQCGKLSEIKPPLLTHQPKLLS